MRLLPAVLGLAVMTVGQSPSQPPAKATGTPPAAGSTAGGNSISPVKFGSNGWPVGVGRQTPAPTGEMKPARAAQKAPPKQPGGSRTGGANPQHNTRSNSGPGDMPSASGSASQPLASGMQLDSHLHDVFRATRTPGAFAGIGGVEVSWQLSIHGTHGETIGTRMITHIADCSRPGRDRLERDDGRIYARSGVQVSAHKGGIPYAALNAQAKAELELFGMHLRLPWCFGKDQSYVIVSRKAVDRRGETLWQLELQGRAHRVGNVFGPESSDTPRDKFFLYYEPTTGQPREFAHRFASSGRQRRVLLEDWQERFGVRMPMRRIYVDEAGRATTTVELKSIVSRRVSERDFRVL